jgi:uncharacterized membrane protein YjfL (UPF0719 family)
MPLRGWLSTLARTRRAEAVPMLSAMALAVITVVTTLFVTLRVFAPSLARIDARAELMRGNVAAAIVITAIMACPSITVLSSITPFSYVIRSHFMIGANGSTGLLRLAAYALGYLAAVMSLALAAVWVSLRVFARLTPEIDEFHEVRKGNAAVAIVLAGVVVVVSMFMQVGTSAIAGALIPQPPPGEVRIME